MIHYSITDSPLGETPDLEGPFFTVHCRNTQCWLDKANRLKGRWGLAQLQHGIPGMGNTCPHCGMDLQASLAPVKMVAMDKTADHPAITRRSARYYTHAIVERRMIRTEYRRRACAAPAETIIIPRDQTQIHWRAISWHQGERNARKAWDRAGRDLADGLPWDAKQLGSWRPCDASGKHVYGPDAASVCFERRDCHQVLGQLRVTVADPRFPSRPRHVYAIRTVGNEPLDVQL